jgi:hypothetical protein
MLSNYRALNVALVQVKHSKPISKLSLSPFVKASVFFLEADAV